MNSALAVILQRRAIRDFEPVRISSEVREQILNAACAAPSSFNIQPYRFYWIESDNVKATASRLCMGQKAAETAPALAVAVADIGSWRSTIKSELQWMRASGFDKAKIDRYEKKSKLGKWFFIQGWFGCLGLLKWLILRVVHLWILIGTPPVFRGGMFKWATKNTSLACENLMIAAEALGLSSCPMEGFDNRRLSRLLKLDSRYHEIVMVIAIGRKSPLHMVQPQWRRPLEATVTFL